MVALDLPSNMTMACIVYTQSEKARVSITVGMSQDIHAFQPVFSLSVISHVIPSKAIISGLKKRGELHASAEIRSANYVSGVAEGFAGVK